MLSSLRAKLVLWYGAIVISTLLAFLFISTGILRHLLIANLDASLGSEAEWVAELLDAQAMVNLPETSIRQDLDTRSRLSLRKQFIEICDHRGNETFASSNLTGERLRPRFGRLLETGVVTARFRGASIRLLGLRTPTAEIYVGYSLTDTEEAVSGLVRSYVGLLPLALALSIGGGLVLVSRFLKPLKNLNAYIERCVSNPLDSDPEKLEIRSRDELGTLALRTEDALDKMRAAMRNALWFASLASHELRTPLLLIRSQLESVMHRDVDREALQSVIASTYDDTLRLGQIVQRLLGLSRMQAGTYVIQHENVWLPEFLGEFHSEALSLAERLGVGVELRSAEPISIEADSNALRMALFNLLDNSLKHTLVGDQIRLDCTFQNGSVLIRFEDTGSGIPSEKVGRIFDSFFSGDAPESVGAGAGLGLGLVRGVIAAHGGHVEVESGLGKGTIIYMYLPHECSPQSGESPSA